MTTPPLLETLVLRIGCCFWRITLKFDEDKRTASSELLKYTIETSTLILVSQSRNKSPFSFPRRVFRQNKKDRRIISPHFTRREWSSFLCLQGFVHIRTIVCNVWSTVWEALRSVGSQLLLSRPFALSQPQFFWKMSHGSANAPSPASIRTPVQDCKYVGFIRRRKPDGPFCQNDIMYFDVQSLLPNDRNTWPQDFTNMPSWILLSLLVPSDPGAWGGEIFHLIPE